VAAALHPHLSERMFEHSTAELLPPRAYLYRQARFAGVAGAIVALRSGWARSGITRSGDLPLGGRCSMPR
jgi:hypothetical protein